MPEVDEMQRVAALRSFDVLDASVDQRFELMAQAAAHLFRVPMVSVTLVDEHRQWRMASWGPMTRETPLEGAICPEAMRAPSLFVVPDLLLDPRFVDSPFVSGHPGLRFYAGWPLKAPGGEPIGSFCIMDVEPRRFSWFDRGALIDLGRWVQEEMLAGSGRSPGVEIRGVCGPPGPRRQDTGCRRIVRCRAGGTRRKSVR